MKSCAFENAFFQCLKLVFLFVLNIKFVGFSNFLCALLANRFSTSFIDTKKRKPGIVKSQVSVLGLDVKTK